jgi:putative transposon-encoded protein
MGVGLSGYTIDWPNGKSLVSRMIYSDPEIQGREIRVAHKARVQSGNSVSLDVPQEVIGVRAYRLNGEAITPGGTDLIPFIKDGHLDWTASTGDCEVWVFTAGHKAGTLNPMHPQAGQRVIEKFFQPFQDHAPGRSADGLNYFFHDELQFGVGDTIWTDDFAEVFGRCKGYDVFDVLPALFTEIGSKTSKARLDFMDVKIQLTEERYFQPIFDWHFSRGKIYGCDNMGRGKAPQAYGDYFRAVRWYTAPGHDTPGGRADLIKGKVSSSIAHLYQRPRVWLEGYHSFGWGATPERLMFATRENYLYGCTLLNLHGLYYTTHGGFWEWAPPCYHFRMPYWDHMEVFLKYFERLSYLLSQGVHQSDIAVLYPVSPHQARLDGGKATDVAFAAGEKLFKSGYDFVFMDHQSLARAEIRDARLHVSDADYRVLVLPAMRAVRWSTLAKAQQFFRAGGIVIAIGALPEASDRAGSDDPELDAVVKELFGTTAATAGQSLARQTSQARGIGLPVSDADQLVAEIDGLLVRHVQADKPVRALHRKIGPRDVYMVMDAPKGSECVFRSQGRAELWDPWTGENHPLKVVSETARGTRVRMPLEDYEAQVIVFTPAPGRKTASAGGEERVVTVSGQAGKRAEPIRLDGPWEFELKPTLDNRWGDFRLPVTDSMIGPEARIFRYAQEDQAQPGWESPDLDDAQWPRVTYGFGPKFWKLGPLPSEVDLSQLEAALAGLQAVDPSVSVRVGGKEYSWSPYAFSWRWGIEGDPGHQGYHGLKENVTDDFIALGKPKGGLNETLYVQEDAGTRYFLWTSVVAAGDTEARAVAGGLKPAAAYVNSERLAGLDAVVPLETGANPLLLRFDEPGRGHFVLERLGAPEPSTRTPLAMSWYDRPGVLPYDVRCGDAKPIGWYRFAAAPGLRAMTVTCYGVPQGWADGRPVRVEKQRELASGATQYRMALDQPILGMAQVALRIEQQRGLYGGSTLPEPVKLECGPGLITAGDWSQGSALECYSGGAWYRKTVTLAADQIQGRVLLNLGDVVATAEVRINGRKSGVCVTGPWTVDITDAIKAGDNRIEILVYNTLANHYVTIPTRYRGAIRSGLLGPVQIEVRPVVTLTRNVAR